MPHSKDAIYVTIRLDTDEIFATPRYRTFFGEFVTEFAAFALSIISVTKYALSFSQEHEQRSAVLNTLFGDASESAPTKDQTT